MRIKTMRNILEEMKCINREVSSECKSEFETAQAASERNQIRRRALAAASMPSMASTSIPKASDAIDNDQAVPKARVVPPSRYHPLRKAAAKAAVRDPQRQ